MEGGLCVEGPIISIDVSNGCSHFRCFIDRNKAFGKVHKIKHDVDGFQYDFLFTHPFFWFHNFIETKKSDKILTK